MRRIRDPAVRVRVAVALLVICVIAWPITSLTVFASEPQGILGLSWLALILTAVDILATTDVRQAGGEGNVDTDGDGRAG